MSTNLIDISADHFVTGSAGFMGGNLLAELVRCGEGNRVHALARPVGDNTARDRVISTLDSRGAANPGRVVVFDGDITESNCGLTDADIEKACRRENPLVFWHLAASLRWEPGRRDSIFEANVDGTRNAMELAKRLGADVFVYVSTAYTCGSLEGDIPEEIHEPPAFNNAYEESKNAAERYVLAQSNGAPRALILRPSIIVGSSATREASGSYTGLYGFITELKRYKKMMGDSKEVVRLSATPDSVLSMIPIDVVVQDCMDIVGDELHSPRQNIYHVTADTGATVGEQTSYIFEQLGLDQYIKLVDDEVADRTQLELFFNRKMEFFSGYIRSTKRFARNRSEHRGLTFDEIKLFIDSEMEKHRNDHQ
ncbi:MULTISPECIES: SDR family oxidoreductase [Mycolicibacter]|uniref:SDR family oxidoreductase n=2 Tax=Mycolicibacter TaxID=1073531 RepID=A0ABU5XPI1_9MYCO|nr:MULTISPECIES: SDR family oxidoreductase [unclassified Mycolicibacter]MEB3022991.1 SDR family oxidoreductase [Mycolicibacter sp. MYC098]MEB3033501.1 SDR family oxidoreductase [Mycolicibacter sp. MYC340]